MDTCCDFHGTPAEIAEHVSRMREQYAEHVLAPKGWEIVPFGDPIPQLHREYIAGAGWAWERTCRSTITPMRARPAGSVRAFARRARD